MYRLSLAGCLSELNASALKAMVAQASNPYGILKANTNWAFYHPLPPVHNKQLEGYSRF
jgi:hypothetical protein